MIEAWLSPLLAWLGIGLVPFLICVVILVLLLKE